MKPMKPEDIKKLPIQQPDTVLLQHDIAIKQLETRLNSLENLVNRLMQNKPPYWEVIE